MHRSTRSPSPDLELYKSYYGIKKDGKISKSRSLNKVNLYQQMQLYNSTLGSLVKTNSKITGSPVNHLDLNYASLSPISSESLSPCATKLLSDISSESLCDVPNGRSAIATKNQNHSSSNSKKMSSGIAGHDRLSLSPVSSESNCPIAYSIPSKCNSSNKSHKFSKKKKKKKHSSSKKTKTASKHESSKKQSQSSKKKKRSSKSKYSIDIDDNKELHHKSGSLSMQQSSLSDLCVIDILSDSETEKIELKSIIKQSVINIRSTSESPEKCVKKHKLVSFTKDNKKLKSKHSLHNIMQSVSLKPSIINPCNYSPRLSANDEIQYEEYNSYTDTVNTENKRSILKSGKEKYHCESYPSNHHLNVSSSQQMINSYERNINHTNQMSKNDHLRYKLISSEKFNEPLESKMDSEKILYGLETKSDQCESAPSTSLSNISSSCSVIDNSKSSASNHKEHKSRSHKRKKHRLKHKTESQPIDSMEEEINNCKSQSLSNERLNIVPHYNKKDNHKLGKKKSHHFVPQPSTHQNIVSPLVLNSNISQNCHSMSLVKDINLTVTALLATINHITFNSSSSEKDNDQKNSKINGELNVLETRPNQYKMAPLTNVNEFSPKFSFIGKSTSSNVNCMEYESTSHKKSKHVIKHEIERQPIINVTENKLDNCKSQELSNKHLSYENLNIGRIESSCIHPTGSELNSKVNIDASQPEITRDIMKLEKCNHIQIENASMITYNENSTSITDNESLNLQDSSKKYSDDPRIKKLIEDLYEFDEKQLDDFINSMHTITQDLTLEEWIKSEIKRIKLVRSLKRENSFGNTSTTHLSKRIKKEVKDDSIEFQNIIDDSKFDKSKPKESEDEPNDVDCSSSSSSSSESSQESIKSGGFLSNKKVYHLHRIETYSGFGFGVLTDSENSFYIHTTDYIRKNSPAKNARLTPGMIIVEINGYPAHSISHEQIVLLVQISNDIDITMISKVFLSEYKAQFIPKANTTEDSTQIFHNVITF